MFDTDIAIIGGGPAGLAAAISASRKGFQVTVADACHPPIDKACGEGLMPDALAAAARLGIDIPADLGLPIRGIRFVTPTHQVAAPFPHGPGRGIRRTALHPRLVETAQAAGARLLWGVSVHGIDGHTVRTAAGPIRARWIIGADGGQSLVRRWAGLDHISRESPRFGFRRTYRAAPWSGHVEIHWTEDCQIYVTPVAANEICLVSISRDPQLRFTDALDRMPTVKERLGAAAESSPERGSFAGTRRIPRIVRGHIALLGDASGTIDAITGEGLCLAFNQSFALADSLAGGGLAHYESEHARLSRRPLMMAGLMLEMDRWSWLRRRAIAALQARPDLFANLVAAHIGQRNLVQLAATAASLCWGLTAL
ncbi:MAG: NAD(P)/FAD-dependent oxidoreductase [Bryobacteraceae bacterium]